MNRAALNKLTCAGEEMPSGFLYTELVKATHALFDSPGISGFSHVSGNTPAPLRFAALGGGGPGTGTACPEEAAVELLDYLARKLERSDNDAFVKLKCLRVYKHLCERGHERIRVLIRKYYIQKIKAFQSYRGAPHALQGDAPSAAVRLEATNCLKILYSHEDGKTRISSIEATGRIEGFGSDCCSPYSSVYNATASDPKYGTSCRWDHQDAFVAANACNDSGSIGYVRPRIGSWEGGGVMAAGGNIAAATAAGGKVFMPGFGNPAFNSSHSGSSSGSALAAAAATRGEQALQLISATASKILPHNMQQQLQKVVNAALPAALGVNTNAHKHAYGISTRAASSPHHFREYRGMGSGAVAAQNSNYSSNYGGGTYNNYSSNSSKVGWGESGRRNSTHSYTPAEATGLGNYRGSVGELSSVSSRWPQGALNVQNVSNSSSSNSSSSPNSSGSSRYNNSSSSSSSSSCSRHYDETAAASSFPWRRPQVCEEVGFNSKSEKTGLAGSCHSTSSKFIAGSSSSADGMVMSASAAAGEYERKIIEELLIPCGAKITPSVSTLQDFCTRCQSLDFAVLGGILLEKIHDSRMVVASRLRLLIACEVLLRLEQQRQGVRNAHIGRREPDAEGTGNNLLKTLLQERAQEKLLQFLAIPQLRRPAAEVLRLLGLEERHISLQQGLAGAAAEPEQNVQPAASVDLLDMPATSKTNTAALVAVAATAQQHALLLHDEAYDDLLHTAVNCSSTTTGQGTSLDCSAAGSQEPKKSLQSDAVDDLTDDLTCLIRMRASPPDSKSSSNDSKSSVFSGLKVREYPSTASNVRKEQHLQATSTQLLSPIACSSSMDRSVVDTMLSLENSTATPGANNREQMAVKEVPAPGGLLDCCDELLLLDQQFKTTAAIHRTPVPASTNCPSSELGTSAGHASSETAGGSGDGGDTEAAAFSQPQAQQLFAAESADTLQITAHLDRCFGRSSTKIAEAALLDKAQPQLIPFASQPPTPQQPQPQQHTNTSLLSPLCSSSSTAAVVVQPSLLQEKPSLLQEQPSLQVQHVAEQHRQLEATIQQQKALLKRLQEQQQQMEQQLLQKEQKQESLLRSPNCSNNSASRLLPTPATSVVVSPTSSPLSSRETYHFCSTTNPLAQQHSSTQPQQGEKHNDSTRTRQPSSFKFAFVKT